MRGFIIIFLAGVIHSCGNVSTPGNQLMIDRVWLDSVRLASDTVEVRSIGAMDFNVSEQLYDTVNRISTKILKDTSGNISAIVQFRDNTRIHFSEYYHNGQVKVIYPLNLAGQFHGPAVYYHENGKKKYSGNFESGMFSGYWDNYDTRGKLVSTDRYNEDGQLVSTENK